DAGFVLRCWRDSGLDPETLSHATAHELAQDWNRSRAPVPEREVAESAHPPVPGESARMEFLVDPRIGFKPVDQGGTVDFRNLNLIKPVSAGQALARKIPATAGIPGIDLYGRSVPAPDGADIEMPLGANTAAAPADPGLILASVAGVLQLKRGLLSVSECFVVDGSVDYSTGNIAYGQAAVIRGDIADGFTVDVGGALEVGGGVGESNLRVGGDVLIKKGFLGSGNGLITSQGTVNLGFSSNQTIRAHGGIAVEKESFNCRLLSRAGISVFGALVGGRAVAFGEIACRIAGNDMGTKTELEAGVDYILQENRQMLEEKIRELTGHLARIGVRLKDFREAYRARKRFTAAEAKTLLALREVQEKISAHLPELERRKADITGKIRLGYQRGGICVRVERKVNPGVVVKIGSEVLRIQEEMAGPKVFQYLQGRI